jgi:hypothetical protein
MTREKDKETGARSIGLATEHRLPAAFKAKTDDDAGTVEIKRENAKPLNVAKNSFASVANLLAVFAPDGKPTLEPGHTIKIIDEFTQRSVTITANTFVDAAAAFQTFLVEKGKYLPEPTAPAAADDAGGHDTAGNAAQEATEAAQGEETASIAAAKPSAARKTSAAASGKAKATGTSDGKKSGKAAPKSAAAKAPSRSGAKAKGAASTPAEAAEAPSKTASAVQQAKPPAWAKSLPTEHVDESGAFRIEARTLALPKPKAKTVDGVADASAANSAFGYEVLKGSEPGGAHAGWIIVEDPKSWIVTGFGDVPPSKHANLNAASIRIRVTNMPRIS